MKRLIVVSIFLLLAGNVKAKFSMPAGAQVTGAGSTLAASFMNKLITKYNKAFPCPTFTYKQTPPGAFKGSMNGINRVLDGKVSFAVSEVPVDALTASSVPDCLIQMPFALVSLSIVYNLPSDFVPDQSTNDVNVRWPGYLTIRPTDLCLIYTGVLTWAALLGRFNNGEQNYTGTFGNVRAFARSDSADETRLLVEYLRCSNSTPTGSCAAFLSAITPTTDLRGPFCSGVAPTWNLATVTCVNGSDAVAQNVLATPGSIGYVMTDVAVAYGLPSAGLLNFRTTANAEALVQGSYVQPTVEAVQNAVGLQCGGEFLCTYDAYPIVVGELFILYATQPHELISCNIAQFIEYALSAPVAGLAPLPCSCLEYSLKQLDKIRPAVCQPCIESCNPCGNQTCPLPCQPCCTP